MRIVKAGNQTFLCEDNIGGDLTEAMEIGQRKGIISSTTNEYVKRKNLNLLQRIDIGTNATVISRKLTDEEQFCFDNSEAIMERAKKVSQGKWENYVFDEMCGTKVTINPMPKKNDFDDIGF